MKDFIPYPRVFSILNLRWLMQTCESILVIVDDSLLEFGVPESITRRGLGTAGVRHGAPSRRAAAALFLPRRRRRAKVPRRTALFMTQWERQRGGGAAVDIANSLHLLYTYLLV